MTFNYEKGTVASYTANGTQIRSGKFEITAWDKGNRFIPSIDGSQAAWAIGSLHTDAGSILFPFKINGGGTKVGKFEILQLSSTNMKLVYADDGTGGWSEATWWAFKAK
jgi:hypothetical protein